MAIMDVKFEPTLYNPENGPVSNLLVEKGSAGFNKMQIKQEISASDNLIDVKSEELDIKEENLLTLGHFNEHAEVNFTREMCVVKPIQEKPFTCSLCAYRTARKHSLLWHMKIHAGEKPFICGVCDYRTGWKHDLLKHVGIHSGKKPFTCSACDFKTARKHSLIRHLKAHTGDKPFTCSVCGYKTASKQHLTDHMKTHTGERPFACSVCDYRTIKKSHRTRHEKKHNRTNNNRNCSETIRS